MKLLLENWKIKLLCVMLASVLFAYVQYTRNVSQEIHVRVLEPELPPNLVFAEEPPSFMKVSIRGPREGVGFEATDLRIELSQPGDLSPGINRFRARLTPKLPEGLKPIFKEEVSIQLGEAMEREIPVMPIFETPLPEGLKIGYLTMDRRTVRLRGPADALESLKRVEATATPITDLRANARSEYSADIRLENEAFTLLDGDYLIEGDVVIVPIEMPEDAPIAAELTVRCSNETPDLRMQVVGSSSVDVVLSAEAATGPGQETTRLLEAVVYCPVFYDTQKSRILPAGRINDAPVEIRYRRGEPAPRVLRVEPAFVDLQFEQVEETRPVNPALQEALKEHQIPQ